VNRAQPRDHAVTASDRRWDNGLHAVTYVPLTDVAPEAGPHLLTALGRARIAAYLDPDGAAGRDRHRLYVATDERGDARTIVASALRSVPDPAAAQDAAGTHTAPGSGPAVEPGPAPEPGRAVEPGAAVGPLRDLPDLPPDPVQGAETDAAFRQLVADWKIDTIAAVRAAERDLNREDADWRLRLNRPHARDEVWLDEDHYVPPVPPPLPRLATPTIIGIIVLILSIVVLGFGGVLGFANDARLALGIGGLLVTSGILLSRVREHRRDDDDDGSAI
jgi:hypothetical protein